MEFVCCAGKGRVFVSFGCNMVIEVIVMISWCNNEVIVIQYVIFSIVLVGGVYSSAWRYNWIK